MVKISEVKKEIGKHQSLKQYKYEEKNVICKNVTGFDSDQLEQVPESETAIA